MSEEVALVEQADVSSPAADGGGELVLPRLVVDAGPAAVGKFLEFFAARIANRRTRAAYGRAVGQFLAWCEARGLSLEAVSPLHVAAYIRTHPGSVPTVKQHLAAIRMLGDWLVVSQVLPVNPAAAVRGPKHVVTKGATPVLSPAEARRLLKATDTGTLAGLRDRALLSVMLYSFARVSAVVAMRRADYFRQESRGWLRLHEKGGKRHDVPAHHRAAEVLDDYLEAGDRGGRSRRGEGTALPERQPGGAAADRQGAVAASRAGDDQAAGGSRGSLAVDLLPHVPGVLEGFERALERKRRESPPVPKLLDGEQEARIIALRLSPPRRAMPTGRCGCWRAGSSSWRSSSRSATRPSGVR